MARSRAKPAGEDEPPTKPSKRRVSPREDLSDLPEGWEPRVRKSADIDPLVERLPSDPGVYVMRDRKGRRIYVGKARNLRTRVRQYFNGHDNRQFVPRLAKLIGDIETIVTRNDKEAMLLENHLIKQHHPRFNVKLRDDKQYLVLRMDPRSDWPRLEVVRNIAHDGAQYFGPYHSASSARHTLRVVNRHFKLRTCSDYALTHRKRACLQYQIDRCPAPCVYEVDEAAYAEQVRDVGLFLGGRHSELVTNLESRMKASAHALEFETAARVRDQLHAIQTTLQAQRVVGSGEIDQDVVGMYREGGQVEFALMHVRGGKLMGSRTFSQKGMELPDAEVLHSFLAAYYDSSPVAPEELLLPISLAEDDAAPLAAWLSEQRGKKVRVHVPERGARKRMVELAHKNAASSFVTRRNRHDDSEAVLTTLRDRLGLSRVPRRIECYDVSHIHGTDAVASMVVFQDGAPDKARYRSFKIKGLHGQGLSQGDRQNDDFASMQEVLGRRFRRAMKAEEQATEDWAFPDLVIIDGGKGQLGRVMTVMQDLGIPIGAEGVDVIALAKERGDGHGTPDLDRVRRFRESAGSQAADRSLPGQALADYVIAQDRVSPRPEPETPSKPERVFVPERKDAIRLRPGSSELFLLTRLRDEAHRFAIGHHRKRRSKRQIASALDEIPGVGPALKKSLLAHFGKVAAIRAASVEELSAVKGVGPALAARICEQLR
jgi:excinuclease ABC subunit C